MNTKLVGNYIGRILLIEGLFMLPPIIIAAMLHEIRPLTSFIGTAIGLVIIGLPLVCVRPKDYSFYAREGFVTVALSWILLSFFGAIPFYASGEIHGFINCFFESVSGFTTTSSSVIVDVEVISTSLLYWRSFTNWLGGMGVLVFMLAVMPRTGTSGVTMHILRAESSGPKVGKLVPRMRHTAVILYVIYIVLTIIFIILLLCGGMSLFESVVTAFGTAGTGGFAVKNNSMESYSPYIQGITAVFMVLFGVNFNIYYLILMKEFKSAVKNEELRAYLGIIAVSVILITLNIASTFENVFEALHHSFFQVASIITTSGFSTVNFDAWPTFSKMILVVLMMFGASAGSTGCGIKIARILILTKSLRAAIQKMTHPRAVKTTSVDGKLLDETTLGGVYYYMTAYSIILVISLLVISLNGFDFETTFTAVVAALNNIGLGFGKIGPLGNFAEFSGLSKLVLSIDMLLGRLELFPMLLLFAPSVWQRNK